jgi:hypothetical protein
MALSVIGVGFGRTGTDSMREALNLLGFGPCHHMLEVTRSEEQKRLWRALAQGARPEWDRLFAGYASCVDWPAAHYWRELIDVYPEAKVILTWRPAAGWWESFERTILKVIEASTDPQSLGIALVAQQALEGRPGDRDHAIALYEAYVAAVKAAVPADRLLVHAASDGWAPLCAHLGVPVPDQSYPRRNSTDDYQRMVAGATAPGVTPPGRV